MEEMVRIGHQIFYGRPRDFCRIRCALARAAGIPTTKLHINVDDDDVAIEVPDLSEYSLVEDNIYGKWETAPDDPILVLLAHSDESGDIQEDLMLPLVARMVELEPLAYEIALEREGKAVAEFYSSTIQYMAQMIADAFAKGWDAKFHLEVIPE